MAELIQDILADWIEIQIRSHAGVPLLFVSGAQGIGKSTAMEHIARHFNQRLAILGLDDFYLTKAERKALSSRIHPLFDVRGPPGTHDIGFLRETIETLKHANASTEIKIPKFDKRLDNRSTEDAWTTFKGCPAAVLVEGWCVGALPAQSTSKAFPLNAVEARDTSGAWTDYQENQLAGPYADLWDQGDAFFHLSAPSFEQVLDWRLQQEATTHGIAKELLSDDQKDWVGRFIQHYERLTRRMLDGDRRAGYTLQVDAMRRPIGTRQTPFIVFSDLDGTLLDHDTYDFNAALPALQRLRDTDSTLVLSSSKTAAEVHDLRQQVGFEHCPAIIENGAGILEPWQSWQTIDDQAYQAIRSILDRVPKDLRQKFEGFGDCTAKHLAQLTGLSLEAAGLAKMRSFSEPGRWSGSAEELEMFLKYLASSGLKARQGGRFLTLSFGATKADQIFTIASRFAPAPILALGDAPNDIEMLEVANYAVIIKNTSGTGIPKLKKDLSSRVIRTMHEAPTGWNTAVLDLMQDLGLSKTNK
ncbi:MAG: HAD-IIB family hydrolase [Pseudomonadota bacterium]